MRIISQDRMGDMPYENREIRAYSDGKIYYIGVYDGTDMIGIASYKTLERAIEVMEEIRQHYYSYQELMLGAINIHESQGHWTYFQMPSE